jgi:sarcosine oxidase
VTFDVVIAGLGATGGAAAWQCAQRGLTVLGLDRFRPPHELASHHGASRIIRETAFEHPLYVPLVRRAYELWSALGSAAPRQDLLIPTGALYAGVPQASVVTGSRRSAREHGVPCDELTAAGIRSRWPVFAVDDGMVGVFEHRAGILRPEACIEALLSAAHSLGAELRYEEPMTGWGVERGGVWVETKQGRVSAGALVLATGAWMKDTLTGLGVASWVERVVQHWFAPAQGGAGLAPERMPIYLFEDADGVIFYGFPLLEGALKCAVHHRGEDVTAETVRRDVTAGEVERVRAILARFIPSAAGLHVRSKACLYTNTPDGDFVIDRHPAHPAVILASACSGIGFKFAPALGEVLADLAAGSAPRFDLAPFALARFG